MSKPHGAQRDLLILKHELIAVGANHLHHVQPDLRQPEHTQIVGYRFARLLYHDGRPYFRSMVKHVVFDTSAEAKCLVSAHRHHDNPAPDPNCVCGFYAVMKSYEIPKRLQVDVGKEVTLVILQVRLSGLVIPGHQGYRAERQDVICAWVYHSCYLCRDYAVAVVPTNFEGNYCLQKEDMPMLPVCVAHRDSAHHDHPAYSLADLTNIFGTEFDWMERPRVQQP